MTWTLLAWALLGCTIWLLIDCLIFRRIGKLWPR